MTRISVHVPTHEVREIEEEWQEFQKMFVTNAEELCGRASGRRKENETRWWNERVQNAVQAKKRAWKKNEDFKSAENEHEYRR